MKAYYHDKSKAKRIAVSIGDPKDIYEIRFASKTKEEALRKAKSKLKELNERKEELNLKLIGNPRLTAEQTVLIEDLRIGVDGRWSIKTLTHTLDQSGFITILELKGASGT